MSTLLHLIELFVTGGSGYVLASAVDWFRGRKRQKADLTAIAIQISHSVLEDVRIELANTKDELAKTRVEAESLRSELAEARAELARYRGSPQ